MSSPFFVRFAGDEQVDSGILAGMAAHEIGVHVELAEILQTDGSHDLQLHRHRRPHQLGRHLHRQGTRLSTLQQLVGQQQQVPDVLGIPEHG